MNGRLSRFLQYIIGLSLTIKLFVVVVIIPTLLATIYYGLIASDIYIAEAKYAVRSSLAAPATDLMGAVMGTTAPASTGEDSYIVKEYILSRDMLVELDKELNLKNHYQSRDIDFITRLDEDATLEDFFEYYKDIIEIEFDETSLTINVLKVRAFTPEFAQQVATAIIKKSEDLVNKLSIRIIDDTLQFARAELAAAEERVKIASEEVTHYRNESQSIDPEKETLAVLQVITGLETNLAQAKAELIEAESYMVPDSVFVKGLRSKVNALKEQVAKERQRLSAGSKDFKDYAQIIYNYEPLKLNQELAEKQYASALASLELARVTAQNKRRYLATFVSPNVPDEAVEPERFMKILTIFIASLLTYAIGGLIWAAIKDHMRN